jgi:hypothetical protein
MQQDNINGNLRTLISRLRMNLGRMSLDRPLIQIDPHLNNLRILLILPFQIKNIKLTHLYRKLIWICLENRLRSRLEHNRALHLYIPN